MCCHQLFCAHQCNESSGGSCYDIWAAGRETLAQRTQRALSKPSLLHTQTDPRPSQSMLVPNSLLKSACYTAGHRAVAGQWRTGWSDRSAVLAEEGFIPICCCYPPAVHRPRVAACSSGRVRAGGGAGCVCVWGVSPWRPGRGWCIASGTPVARSLCAATAAIRSWSLRPGPLLHPSCAGRQHPTRPKQPAAQRKKPWQRSGLGRARGSADLFLSAAISSHSAAHRPSSRPFSYPATLVTKAV